VRLLLALLLVAGCGAPPAPAPRAPTGAATAETRAAQPAAEQAPTPTAAAAARRPLVQAYAADLSKTLHPYPDASSYTQAWLDTAALIWGGADGGGALLAFDWDSLAYRPAMAREMPRVSPDGKAFAFTLRDNLRWSDGSPITSEDFQFAYSQVSRDDSQYVQLDIVQDIAGVRVVDPKNLEIELREKRPRDVALGIANVIVPVPRKVWEGKSWTDATTNPEILNPSIVLGPFRVQEFKPAERAVFSAIDTYYVGKPRVPRVEILPNHPQTAAFEALKSGRANWVRNLPPALYADARTSPDLDVKEWTPANATYRTLEFNLTRPPLSDRRVREALALAVNRTDLLNMADQGLGTPQYSFIQPSNTRWANSNVNKYDFDMQRAQQLLQEAGVAGQTVTLQVVFPSSSTPRARIAAYLQQQYAQLGIEVDVRGLNFTEYTDTVQNRHDFDISLAAWGGGSLDPDLGAKSQLIQNGQQNVTGYANPQVDEWFRQAASELDDARRRQLYDQIQVQVNADLPSHYLYALKAIDVFSRKVHGVTPRKSDRLDANDALLSWSVSE
jgi:peptide/nickel transport system substrate-binding protein